jgi:hypothetical protein
MLWWKSFQVSFLCTCIYILITHECTEQKDSYLPFYKRQGDRNTVTGNPMYRFKTKKKNLSISDKNQLLWYAMSIHTTHPP